MIKRTLLFAATVVMAITCTVSNSKSYDAAFDKDFYLGESKNIITKSYDYTGFNGFQVGNGFEVTLIKSDKYSVVVEIDEKFVDDLRVSMDNNLLKVGLKDVFRLRNLNGVKKVTISMPVVTRVGLSGASSLYTSSEFDCGMSRFVLTASGASTVRNLNVNAVDCYFDISGASSINFIGSVSEAEIDLSGASKGTFEIQSSEVDIELSGASKASLVGSSNEMDAELSGASSLDADRFQVDDVDLDCSGASSALVDVNKRFDVELSGASKCTYRSHNTVIVKQSVTGASSLRSK